MSELRELKSKALFYYIIGAFGNIFTIAFYTAYSYQYYTYTIGLDSLLTSVGIFIGLIFNAVGSPFFGFLSDKKKASKYGKRRLYMLYGLPLYIITGILIWYPPLCPKGDSFYWPCALYFWVMSIGVNVGYVEIVSPYMALLPEISQTEKNRIFVSGIQGIFSTIGTVLSILIPMIIQSELEDPTNTKWWEPSGQYLISRIPIIGMLFAIGGGLFIFLSAINIDETFRLKDGVSIENNAESGKTNFIENIKHMQVPFRNTNFRLYLLQATFGSIGGRILIVVLLPFLTYILLLEGTRFIILTFLLVPFAFLGFAYWGKQIEKVGLISANSRACFVQSMALILFLFFLMPIPEIPRIVIGALLLGVIIVCFVGGFLFPNPIVSAIIEEPNTVSGILRSNQSQLNDSGTFFGLYLFMLNIAGAVSNLIIGSIFTGGKEEDTTLITVSFPIAAVFFLIALYFLMKISLKKKLCDSPFGSHV